MHSFFGYCKQLVRTIVAPYFCRSCKLFLHKDEIFCQSCFDLIEPLSSATLKITTTISMKIYAAGVYRDPLRYLIMAKSWSDRTAAWQLGQLMWRLCEPFASAFDIIVPIPLFWRRTMKRGFNQAQIMADAIAQHSNKKVVPLVTRNRATVFQSMLTAPFRFLNVKDAFVLDRNLVASYQHQRILLIDDLVTTGATLHSVAKVLVPLKPASLTAFVGARVRV